MITFDMTHPQIGDNYSSAFVPAIINNQNAAAMFYDSLQTTRTDTPLQYEKRFNRTSGLFDEYNGTTWGTLATSYAAVTAVNNFQPFQKIGSSVAAAAPSSTDLTTTSAVNIAGSGGNGLWIGQYTGTLSTWIQAAFANPTTATYNMVLQPIGGKVGIGTGNTALADTLQVAGGLSGTYFRATGANNNTKGYNLGGDTGNGLVLYASTGTAYDFSLINPSTSSYIFNVPTGTVNATFYGSVSAIKFSTLSTSNPGSGASSYAFYSAGPYGGGLGMLDGTTSLALYSVSGSFTFGTGTGATGALTPVASISASGALTANGAIVSGGSLTSQAGLISFSGSGSIKSNDATYGMMYQTSVDGTSYSHTWTNAAGSGLMYLTSAGVASAANFIGNSDAALKENWKTPDHKKVVNFLAGLQNYGKFDWKTGGSSLGITANDFQDQPIYEHAVHKNAEGILGFDYGSAAMVSAVALAKHSVQQDSYIDDLLKRVAELEAA